MGQAFDQRGNPLGDGVYGETKREVFDKLMNLHPDAHEIRIKSMEAKLAAELDTGAQTPMPRYKCHKEVWALKIAEIRVDDVDLATNGATITPGDYGYAPFRVDAAYLKKHAPKVGGYYVVYDDGYKSFSPAKAFEEGYTRL